MVVEKEENFLISPFQIKQTGKLFIANRLIGHITCIPSWLICICVFVYLYLSRLVGRHLYSLMNNSANLHFNAIKLSRFKTLRKDFKKYKQLDTYYEKIQTTYIMKNSNNWIYYENIATGETSPAITPYHFFGKFNFFNFHH